MLMDISITGDVMLMDISLSEVLSAPRLITCLAMHLVEGEMQLIVMLQSP
jgi:hypothetical protein